MRALLAIALLMPVAACATAPPTAAASRDNPSAFAPTHAERDEILKTIDTFLLALGNGDRELQKSIELPDGMLAIAPITKDGAGPVGRMSHSVSQGQPARDPFIEMYWNPQVEVRGPFAHVWAPYELRDNGAVVHCGIDAFQLVRIDGAWKIHAGISSMEPDACEELGAPSATDRRPRDGWRETRNE